MFPNCVCSECSSKETTTVKVLKLAYLGLDGNLATRTKWREWDEVHKIVKNKVRNLRDT